MWKRTFIILLVTIFGHNVMSEDPLVSESVLPSDESEEQSVETVQNPTFYFNLSNSSFDELEQVLAGQFAKANVPSGQQMKVSLDITPPANSTSEFITKLGDVIKKIAAKNAPFAGTSIGIAATKTSSGILTNVKVKINLTPPKVATLPPSTLPEINLRSSTVNLDKDLEEIVSNEISKQGYDAGSTETQDFTLNFNVLPPDGATKDYVKLNVIKPLQKVVRASVPRGSIVSISVNTQESHGKILRQTVKANVRVKPVVQPKFSENVVEVPEIDLNKVGNISVTLQEIIAEENSKDKTIAIPIKVKATDKEVNENVEYIERVLKALDPSTRIVKVTKENLENGNRVFTVYVDFEGESGSATSARPSSTKTTKPEVPTTRTTTTARATTTRTTTTTRPTTTRTTTRPTTTRTTTRPTTTRTTTRPTTTRTTTRPTTTRTTTRPPTTTSRKPTEATPQGRSLNDVTEQEVPKNAIQTSVVDFTSKNSDPSQVLQVLEEALSNSSLAKDASVTLAIPFKFPSISAEGSVEEEKVEQEIDQGITSLLKRIEPSGVVVDSIGRDLDNAYETIVYFKIPSLKDSTIYKVLEKSYNEKPAGKIVEAPVINLLNSVISPDTVEDEVKDALDDILVPNTADDKGGVTIGFPVVISSDVAELEQSYANAIAKILNKLEPSGVLLPNIVTKPLSNGNVQFTIYYRIPSIKDSNTYKKNEKNDLIFDNDQGTYINGKPIDNNGKPAVDFIVPTQKNDFKNAIKVPTITSTDNLLDTLKKTLGKTLPNYKNFEKNQQFDFEFLLNPKDFQGSVQKIAKALESLDPKGQVDSYKIRTGSDGVQYLDLGFLVPNFVDSPIYKLRNILEIVDIDAKKPYDQLLEKVINVTDAAMDDVQGVKEGEDIDLSFGFKIVNSEGMSDKEVSQLIKNLSPKLKNFIGQVLPDSKLESWKIISDPNSDDVVLKFVVKTQYEPDDVVVIQNVVRKKTTTTTTTTTKKPRRGFLWFG